MDETTPTQPQAPKQAPGTLRRRPAQVRARKRRIALLATLAGVVIIALIATLLVLDAQRRSAEAAAEAQRIEQEAAEAERLAEEKAAEKAAEAERQRVAEEKAAAEKAAAEAAAREKAISDPASISVVINKQRPFDPVDWAPDGLVTPDVPNSGGQLMREVAATAIENMYDDAAEAGAPFFIISAYRSYGTQVQTFASFVQRDGVEAAETYSARPGHSEHQTGLVADLDDGNGCRLESCFGETAAGTWVRDNAYKYGFIMRYNIDQEPIVGYIYEPWHYRYVGTEIAGEMHEQGIQNLEDYFDLPAAPTY